MDTFKCVDCKQVKPVANEGGTGYARLRNNHKVCYDCVAIRDRKDMIKTGAATLYLARVKDDQRSFQDASAWNVTNWPGTLRFDVMRYRKGNHNIGGVRRDVWFKGPDGEIWHGACIGDWTQICRAKRTKAVR